MAKERAVQEEHKTPGCRSKAQEPAAPSSPRRANKLANLQKAIGNRAVQRMLNQRAQIQRSGGAVYSEGAFDLDDETAARINRERGGGQPLDAALQQGLGASLGQDLSGVRVHASPEADTLNREINAKAFTTGQDVFFRKGAYEPHSSGGQELIAHELAHVVQQSSGAVAAGRVGGGSRMTVNAPGDAFEQQADAVAKTVTSNAAPQVQRQQPEEEEETRAQPKPTSEMEEEETVLQAATLQRQEEPEEETIQAQAAQRQEMEEEETW